LLWINPLRPQPLLLHSFLESAQCVRRLVLVLDRKILRRRSPKSRLVSAPQPAARASGVNSGRAGAISKSDAVAIDMVLFSGMDEGEVHDSGLGLRWVWFWKADDGSADGRRFQPPAVFEQPPWQSRSPELNADDFPHGRTMRRRLAARLPGMFRICVFSCRFRADAAQTKEFMTP